MDEMPSATARRWGPPLSQIDPALGGRTSVTTSRPVRAALAVETRAAEPTPLAGQRATAAVPFGSARTSTAWVTPRIRSHCRVSQVWAADSISTGLLKVGLKGHRGHIRAPEGGNWRTSPARHRPIGNVP